MTEATAGPTEGQQRYLKAFDARMRRTNLAVRARAFGVQAAWAVALLAGAAIPLAQALGWPDWVTAVLGFVVVVVTGGDRLFARTVGIGEALDNLRRRLARERRLLTAGSSPYSDPVNPYAVFIQRTEDAIAEYDKVAGGLNAKLAQEA